MRRRRRLYQSREAHRLCPAISSKNDGEYLRTLHDPLCHIRVDQAWMHAVDPDPQRCHFGGHVAGECFETKFRRRIVCTTGQNLTGLNRTDMHNNALPGLRYDLSTKNLGTKPCTAQIDVGKPCPLLIGKLEKGNDGLDTRIIDQNVDRAEFLPGFVDHGLNVGTARNIAFHCDGNGVLSIESVQRLLRPVSRMQRSLPRRRPLLQPESRRFLGQSPC